MDENCPLVTPYTKRVGISDELLEKLFLIRQWDIDSVKAGTLEPVPFKWPSLLRHEYTNQLGTFPVDIKEYQKQMVAHLVRLPRFIAGDSVGLGKTVECIASACWLLDKNPNTKFIVLTTKSTTWQWYNEIIKFSELKPYVVKDKYKSDKSYTARLKQFTDFLEGDKKNVIISKYSSLIGKRRVIAEQFDNEGNPTGKNKKERVSQEIRFLCDILEKNKDKNIVLILDEAHKFKGLTSQTRNLVSNISRNVDRVWALTATVIKNKLDEFYNIAHAIGIAPFGNPWEFKYDFCILRDMYIGRGQKREFIVGYKNVPEFKTGMRPFYLGRSQKQVKEPLPKLVTIYHEIELSDKQKKLLLHDIPTGKYELPPAVKKVADEIYLKERDPDNAMTMLSVYQLVANYPGLLDRENEKEFFSKKLSPKEEYLLELLEGELSGEKVIVFTKYRSWIDRLDELTKRGHFTTRKFLRITGAENEKAREKNKQLFQESPEHDLIVINTAAIEGVNLQQAAHQILLDCPWGFGDLLQLVGRMVRMSSPHSSCTLHVLTALGTIDEYTLSVLKSKKEVFKAILGDSHIAGLLDTKGTFDLNSGMDKIDEKDNFLHLLKAHVQKTSMNSFISGSKLKHTGVVTLKPPTTPSNNEKENEYFKRWGLEE